MNKVTAINLGGTAFQLEESGYDALRAYLESGFGRLQGNPDREEIISDIERAIADKFRALLTGHKNVVEAGEVTSVLAAMGPIQAEAGDTAGAGASGGGSTPGQTAGQGTPGNPGHTASGATPRRLYRIREGRMIEGVCTGLAAYSNLDPTLVRLGFVLLTFFGGTGVVAYIVMVFVVPEAETPEQKAAATGFPATAQEFIRRAKEGYYETMKNFPDRQARRAWRRQFKREMRANAQQWSCNWQACWGPSPAVHPGMGFTLPILSLLQGAATIFWLCAIVSLLATGAVLGRSLPANVPVWVAALVLLLVYAVIAGPIKAARRWWYWGLRSSQPTSPVALALDWLVWVLVAITVIALGIHFFPQLRSAVEGLPAVAHQAASDVRDWWKGN